MADVENQSLEDLEIEKALQMLEEDPNEMESLLSLLNRQTDRQIDR